MGTVVVGALLLVRLWRRGKAHKAARARFLAEFDRADLRMSPYRLGRVYHLISVADDAADVMVIWDAGEPVSTGQVIRLSHTDLIPFDPRRFT